MTTTGYVVGRGIGDVTGEPAECGMLGYGKHKQATDGIHTRLRARAFVILDVASDQRLLLVVSDLPLMFDSVRREVLGRLSATYGQLYTSANVMLTVTHTHCGPGGYAEHALYNGTTGGFRPQTFGAIVDGIVEAIDHAHEDLAPATLTLSSGALHDASVNRSPSAFARNPAAERAFFPQAIDPQTTLLRIERNQTLVGVINWFATHGTSMTNHNTLISGDNKGYAAYYLERLSEGIDYRASNPRFVAAFAQTNTGDMSPNLNRRPGSGPTEDEFENARIIGQRQADAATTLAAEPGRAVTGGVDARLTWVNLSDVAVRPEFTGDGREHRTNSAMVAAASLAGTDEGPGFPGFHQGRNRVWDALSRHLYYRLSPRWRDAHAPKAIVLPGALANRIVPLVPERFPVQLLRIGPLYLLGIPGEVTIVAGLRLRHTVASIVGADVADVLVAGYSNGYFHYVTTPQEYEAQRYEGGSTLFGRWQLGALQQVAHELATAMRDGRPVAPGTPAPGLSARRRSRRKPVIDEPLPGYAFGDVVEAPRAAYRNGEQVRAMFAGAYPNNDLHRGGTYLEVQRGHDESWITVADDGDWATKLRWTREGKHASRILVTWDIPPDTIAGYYRIRYHGDARDVDGQVRPFTAATGAFELAN